MRRLGLICLRGMQGINLSQGKWGFNEIARDGGRFLWRQIFNVKKEGAGIIYGAMWDECVLPHLIKSFQNKMLTIILLLLLMRCCMRMCTLCMMCMYVCYRYDEGTAFMPVVSYKRQLPQPGRFLALDEDGYDLPSDWYVPLSRLTPPHPPPRLRINQTVTFFLPSSSPFSFDYSLLTKYTIMFAIHRYMRISGFASDILRGERTLQEPFPVKDLQDYWSHRPRDDMEDLDAASGSVASGSGSGSGSGAATGGAEEAVAQSFDEWLAAEKEEKDDLPPPPYTLEAEEGAVVDEAVLVNPNANANSGTTVAGTGMTPTTNTNTNTNTVPDHRPAAQSQQNIPPTPGPQTQTQTQTRPASLPVPPNTNTNLASRPSSVASAQTQSSFSVGAGPGVAYTPPSRVSSLSATQRPAVSASVQSGLAHRPSLQASSSSSSSSAGYSYTGPASVNTNGQNRPPASMSSFAGQYQQTPAVGYQQQQGPELGRYTSYHSVSSGAGVGGPGAVDALSNDFNRQSLADGPPAPSHVHTDPPLVQGTHSPYAPHGPVATVVGASAQGQFSSPAPHAEARLHQAQAQQSTGYAHPSSPPVQWPPPEWALPDSGPNRLSPPALPTSARPPPPPPPQHPARPPRPAQQNQQNQNQNQNQAYAPPRPGGSTYPNQYRPHPPPQAPIAPNAAYQAPPPQPQQPWAAFPQPNTISPHYAAGHVPYTAHMPTPPPRTSSLDQGGYGAGPSPGPGLGMPAFPGANLNMHVPPPQQSQPSGYGATPGFFDGHFPESQGSTTYAPASSPWLGSAPSPSGYPPRMFRT